MRFEQNLHVGLRRDIAQRGEAVRDLLHGLKSSGLVVLGQDIAENSDEFPAERDAEVDVTAADVELLGARGERVVIEADGRRETRHSETSLGQFAPSYDKLARLQIGNLQQIGFTREQSNLNAVVTEVRTETQHVVPSPVGTGERRKTDLERRWSHNDLEWNQNCGDKSRGGVRCEFESHNFSFGADVERLAVGGWVQHEVGLERLVLPEGNFLAGSLVD